MPSIEQPFLFGGRFFFCIRQGEVALIIRQLFFQSLLEEGIDRREKTPQPAPVQAEERRILVVKATKKIGIVTENKCQKSFQQRRRV